MYGTLSPEGDAEMAVVADCSSKLRADGTLKMARDMRAGRDTRGIPKVV